MTQKETIAQKIDALVVSSKYLEAKNLYLQNYYLFKEDEMCDIILYDLYVKSGSMHEADVFKRIILSAPNIANFDKMAIAFLSGDEKNGRLYLAACEKDPNLKKSQDPLLKYFRESSNHGEFVSVSYKIDWKLSKS